MSRNDFLVRVVAAVVGIVAVAIAAATVRSPVEVGGDGGAGGSGTGDGHGPQAPASEPITGVESVPAFLEYLAYAVVIVLALALAWYLIFHRRGLVKMLAVYLAVALIILALVAALLHFGVADDLNMSQQPIEEPPEDGGEGGQPGDGDGEAETIPFGPLLGVLAIITMIFVGALVLSTERGGDEPVGAVVEAEPEENAGDAAAVAAAAGRAAERIEAEADIDNEVYRAWKEMTDLLEVPRPETSTPGEFAAAAVDAGLEREHVDELTRLFEDVRYGHSETTDEMEARAVAVLRRIEDEYAREHETERSRAGSGGVDE
ncbi:DUF4129 domain-containing protein [Natrononativus amylolyticus]|uniref:DUF4129 domain-containing protein n=1 Tax=Natrononativus amylolyticus TaxID=2963434 RepID=UPI0020CF6F29|nr:DUF4129 domain-containing protein [Natrononativus amylolyticus]